MSTASARKPFPVVSAAWGRRFASVLLAVAVLSVGGCGERATLPPHAGVGESPELPSPRRSLIPTLKIAPAVGWAEGEAPTPATGLRVTAFARGLDHPRWLYVLPNGDVLVAETNAPPREGASGLKAWAKKRAMKRAGAAVPSANRISLLRDADGDGVAETRSVFRAGLNSPFGMTLLGDALVVANTDALVRFPYRDGDTELRGEPQTIAPLPAGPINHHWTKNVIATPDGTLLLATVGSNSNVAENGIENEAQRAAILAVDPSTGATRVYASGLRNPNGLAFEPVGGALWTTVNERDELGSDLVPDYMTSVRDGDFFGWPWSYFGAHVDTRVEPARPDLVARARVPDYALGTHVAALGLAFAHEDGLPAPYRDGAFVGEHGSWNRDPPYGYQVVFVPFRGGKPDGAPRVVLSGFLDADGNARGRPVGVAMAKDGALLVADDVGNVVWRVSAAE
jgi:glucose/arabinose dehydrogenase